MPKRKRTSSRKRLRGRRRKRAIALYRRKRWRRRKYFSPGQYRDGLSEENFRHKYVRMRYFTTMTLVTGANQVPVYQQFAAANCYEPYTGGHSPLFASALATNYTHYVVTGSKITVKFMNDPATASYSGRFHGVYMSRGNTTGVSDLKLMIERKFGNCVLRGVGYNNKDPVLHAYYNPRKTFGIKDTKDSLASLGAVSNGTNATTPSNKPTYFVMLQNTTNAAVTCRIGVWIDYTVMYYNTVLHA